MTGMSNAQAALIAAATQAKPEKILERAELLLMWLNTKDAESGPRAEDRPCEHTNSAGYDCERPGGDGHTAHQFYRQEDSKPEPITQCGHQPRGWNSDLACRLAKGHAGVHRVTDGDVRHEWSETSPPLTSWRHDAAGKAIW